jgi:two-component system, NtrC family, sensor histidine kinase KinB
MKEKFKIFKNSLPGVNLKLKSQIILGYLFMLLLIILLIFNSIVSLNNLDKSSERILKENSVSIESGLKMNLTLMEMTDILTKITHEDKKENKISIDRINDCKAEFEKNLKIAENIITETGENEIIQRLRMKYKEYAELISNILNKKEPESSLINEAFAQYRDLSLTISDLIAINHTASLQKDKLTRDDFRTAWIYIIIVGAGALLLAYTAIIKLPKAIIKPLDTITEQILEISNGKYGQTIEEKSKNELGILSGAFNQMSKKLYEYQQSNISIIVAQKSRIESIVNSLKDAIIVLDENKKFVLFNPKAIALLGISGESLMGKTAPEIAVYNNLMRDLLKMMDNQEEAVKEKPIPDYIKILEDGREEYYSKELIKVYNTVNIGEKSFLGYIIELKNITDFKEIDDAKSNFIATLSHEVRTPLSAMNMSLSLLLNNKIGAINEEQEKIIISIKDEIQRLLSIISNLFDLSKFEAGHILIRFQKTDLNYLINYSLAPFYNQIKEKNLDLVIKRSK